MIPVIDPTIGYGVRRYEGSKRHEAIEDTEFEEPKDK